MSAKQLANKVRAAIAKKAAGMIANEPPPCGFVTTKKKFKKKYSENVYQIIRSYKNYG